MSEPIFLRIDRNAELFKNRAITFKDVEGNILESIPVPGELIVCDSCNAKIDSDKIDTLIFDGGYIGGVYCENCRVKYYPNFEIKEYTKQGGKINE